VNPALPESKVSGGFAVLTMSENREIPLTKMRDLKYGVTGKKHLLSSFAEP
jgi:hypothetical protein